MKGSDIMNNTKENILLAALHLFARDGYEAVSVSRIAGELGITKGALYRHFQNKRDIFNHIVKRMEQSDSENASKYDMPGEYDKPEGDKDNNLNKHEKVSLDSFLNYSISMFSYWTENDFASSFRKMLTLEQFRNKEMQDLYQQYLVSGPLEYVKYIFESMHVDDAYKKAIHFYSNMYFFYSMYDGATDKVIVKEQFERATQIIINEL